VQALDRTQPILPLCPVSPSRQSHDYERHGVMSLFTALNARTGATIAACHRRHRLQEFLRLLKKINASVPAGVAVHIVIDKYGTHKVARVRQMVYQTSPLPDSLHSHQRQLAQSRRERLFGKVTKRCVRRGSHAAITSIEKAMLGYLDERNKDPKPFIWTADADLILGKVQRLCERIGNSGD
jgi:hypothetical protein